MGFAMEAKTEWKMGKGGGGTHSSPTAFCLGISAPHHPEFCLGMGGDTKVFYHHRSDYGRFKSHHLQAQITLTALSVSQWPPFFQQDCG